VSLNLDPMGIAANRRAPLEAILAPEHPRDKARDSAVSKYRVFRISGRARCPEARAQTLTYEAHQCNFTRQSPAKHKQWKVPVAFWNQKDQELVRSLELSGLPANGA